MIDTVPLACAVVIVLCLYFTYEFDGFAWWQGAAGTFAVLLTVCVGMNYDFPDIALALSVFGCCGLAVFGFYGKQLVHDRRHKYQAAPPAKKLAPSAPPGDDWI